MPPIRRRGDAGDDRHRAVYPALFLFSALAGQLADRFDKARLVRVVKAAEVGIMLLALAGFRVRSVPVLLACLFLMGVHSTIFGPVEYSILPQHLREGEVMGGTGMIEAGTFLAILGGQLLGGVVPPWAAGLVETGVAVLGLVASLAVPPAPPAAPGLRIERNVRKGTWDILKVAHGREGVWPAILGISWFFSMGTILLSEFAPLCSGTLHGRAPVVTLFLLVFSVSARHVPVAALGLALFQLYLWIATSAYVPGAPRTDVAGFLTGAGGWHILAALAGIAFSGGVFIVPLYAILQVHSAPAERSRVVAANNIVNAAVTVAMVAVVTLPLGDGTGVPGVIGALGFATLAVALISCWLLPETVPKALVRGTLRLLYRVDVHGADNMPRPGGRWWWSTTCRSSTGCCSPHSCPAGRPPRSTAASPGHGG